MANYYLDTEFLEGAQKEKFPISLFRKETKPTIDLISIGICSSDDREYYAISKDFSLREAWNRYQIKQVHGDVRNRYPNGVKEYWIRENVLKPIFIDLIRIEYRDKINEKRILGHYRFHRKFTYENFKRLINKYGKTNKQIAEEVKDFVSQKELLNTPTDEFATKEMKSTFEGRMEVMKRNFGSPQFYTYYGAYDHVVFCWLFGKMIDLPKGFPMYSNDLKQVLDEKIEKINSKRKDKNSPEFTCKSMKQNNPNYPKQDQEHNALADARWNKKLHEFLKSI